MKKCCNITNADIISDLTQNNIHLSMVEGQRKLTRVVETETDISQITVREYVKKENWHPN